MSGVEIPSALERRVASLERQNRLLLAGLIAAVGASLVGASGPGTNEVVRAGAFEVIDSGGRVVAALRAGTAGPELVLRDAAEVTRLRLSHDAEQTALMIQDASGTTRVGVAQFAHGGGGFALHGEEARGAAVLYLAKGEGSLRFFGTEGQVLAKLPREEGH